MSLSALPTSEQLEVINEDAKNMNRSVREVQEQGEDGEEVLDSENTSSGLNTVLNTIKHKLEHKCLDEAVRLLNADHIRQSPDYSIPGRKSTIPGLPGTTFLAHQVWAICFIIRRCSWDAVMPGVLVAVEMSLGKTFTSIAVAMLSKLVTEKVVIGLPVSYLWVNTLGERVILARNDFPGIVGEELEWTPLQRLNSVLPLPVGDPIDTTPLTSSTDLSP
jgi:hypothetical protein